MSSPSDKVGDVHVLEHARVLLVDDSAQDRELIERELRRVAPEVTLVTARDARELEAALADHTFDLAITDYQLHWSTGIEVLRQLKGHDARVPVVMFTASGSEEIAVTGMKEGLDDYITKTVKHYSRLPYVAAAAIERNRTRRQLWAERVERSRLLESMPEAFYAVDRDWRFTYINQRALDYFQFSRDEVMGRSIWECIPNARGTFIESQLLRVMSEKTPLSFEARSSGAHSWAELHAYPANDGIAVHFRNVTQRKRNEAALRDAEERYRAFVRNSSEAIWRYELEEPLDLSLDPEAQLEHLYRYAYLAEANDAMAHMYGYESADEMIGARLEATLPRADETSTSFLRALIEQSYRIHGAESAERDRAGRLRYFTNSMVPVIEHGKLLRAWGSQRDVTEQKLSEATLRESEERLRRAVNVSTVGVLFFSLDGGIGDANEAFQRMSGYSRDELIAHSHWKTLTLESFHPITEAAAKDLIERGRTEPYEKQMRRKDGSTWWGLFAPTRLSGEGTETACVEFIIDITEKRRALQALEQADRRKDEFLATLAHELRNPLAPLKNGLQIARLTSAPDASLQRVVDMMDRQLNHLVRLVDDLLDVARISSGKVVLKRERVLLREVLAHAVEASRAGIDARTHDLVVDLPTEEVLVEGDFDRLAQVFSNLLSNAAKYTHSGGHIRVRLKREGRSAVVQVIDDGIGIPPDALQNVFDLFSQVREHQRHAEGGLGIGLSLVKTLVAHHGGSVSAESAGIGAGSTFTVRLPLLQPRGEEPATSAPDSRAQPAPGRRRILVVDDNVDAAESMATLIALQGHDVDVAHSGQEALEKIPRARPTLIFLDLGMPGMDGIETARRLRATPEGECAVLVALTGWGQPADRARTSEAGFDAHLVKPIDANALQRALALTHEEARALAEHAPVL